MDKLLFFKKARHNLAILENVEENSTPDYLCPLCMQPIAVENAKEVLTQEDVPQKSLGGQQIALTCRTCNSTCGANIDNNLLNWIKSIEQEAFLPGTDRAVTVYKNNKRLNAELKVGENKELSLYINTKRNDPRNWNDFHNNILLENNIVDIQNAKMKINGRRISAAILKNAYLILFARTGYTVLKDPFYDNLRRQIMDPIPYILPERLWTIQPINVRDGIYLTRDNRYRGFFIVYTLTLKSSYKVGVLIPTPKVDYHRACEELKKIGQGSIISVSALPYENDFFEDYASIKRLQNWAYGWSLTF